jgi:hypothetical protein
MARRNEAGQYLLSGLTLQQIELRMGIGLGSVRQYLCTLVGEVAAKLRAEIDKDEGGLIGHEF